MPRVVGPVMQAGGSFVSAESSSRVSRSSAITATHAAAATTPIHDQRSFRRTLY